VSVTTTDDGAQFEAQYTAAAKTGVDVAANHLRVAVQKAFGSDYYKGGAFRLTLQVKQSVRREVTRGPRGWEAVVGTKFIEALYWELGHRNLFTRKYERVELWVPTALREVDAMRAAFARVVRRIMLRPSV